MSREPFKMALWVRHEGGSGLIEAMMAMVILAIGILAIASGEVQSITMNQKTRETLKAASTAESMMAMIRRNSLSVANYQTSTEAIEALQGMEASDFTAFKRSIETDFPGTTSRNLNCGGGFVKKACGWVTVEPSPFPGSIPDANMVTVSIVWPGKRNGISVSTIVVPGQ